MANIHVELPKPCDEKWDDMTPAGCHRHCAFCDKVIHDLEQMTGEEARALVESGEEACFRAKVDADGAVLLSDSRKAGSIRLRTAAVGAVAGLALAACSTTPIGSVSPRITLSGNLDGYWGETQVRLVGEGVTKTKMVRHGGEYQFANLKPGSYRLHVEGYCIEDKSVDISLTEDDVIVEPISPEEGEWGGCIIVGVMQRADPPARM